ncbi:hypothetical protein YPPY45_2966 [Yersinia pestis PY-45]|uniref:Uncharacterized protein n=1 Tax=Yersinia pestis PY-08 TaxID=992134 RepID=A0AB72ZN63_YERPE|nr:hypothetical protein YPPY08_3089 [Yersinia pestis PY-08]EIR91133.1 hypothetical protein YPPY45_2966 [Yersinia pestis PY-45]EIT39884.1 hypothetical protein YPPY99_3198 [Yersinia pestis PY-99]
MGINNLFFIFYIPSSLTLQRSQRRSFIRITGGSQRIVMRSFVWL